jgi:hypothetical protein
VDGAPNENPDDAGLGCSPALDACRVEDEPNVKPEEVDLAGPSCAAAGAGVDEDPKLNPDVPAPAPVLVLALDEPNENVEAEGPPGDPLLGTAAPNENAVDGDVEGCLAPKEKLNDLAGVEVGSVVLLLVLT